MGKIRELLRSEDGATAVEYALIAAVISVIIVAALLVASGDLEQLFLDVQDDVASASQSG